MMMMMIAYRRKSRALQSCVALHWLVVGSIGLFTGNYFYDFGYCSVEWMESPAIYSSTWLVII